jgi:hypothetical protein
MLTSTLIAVAVSMLFMLSYIFPGFGSGFGWIISDICVGRQLACVVCLCAGGCVLLVVCGSDRRAGGQADGQADGRAVGRLLSLGARVLTRATSECG